MKGEGTSEKKGLESIVPTLELCRRIPQGAFADSALIWFFDGTDWWVNAREFDASSEEEFPAPTTDEILAELAKFPHYFNNATLEIDKDAFIVGAFKPNRGNPGSHLTENRDARPVVAALKLWLEVDDVEVGK